MNRLRRYTAAAVLALTSIFAHGATVSDGIFTIHGETVDQRVLDGTVAELIRASTAWSDQLPAGADPITVYVCGTAAEFIHRAGPYARADIGGVAMSREGIVIMKAPNLLQRPGDYAGILRHELIHVLLARNYNIDNLPRWLNEGLAMQLSGEYRWASWMTLGDMYVNGRVLEYPDLLRVLNSSPGELSYGDAYAQSLSMTAYLRRKMGDDAFWLLMRDLDTLSFGQALEARTGWIPLEFWRAWMRSLWTYALAFSVLSGLSLFQVAAFILIWGYLKKRRRSQRILQRMEEEDDDEPMPWEVFDGEGPYDWEENYRDRT